MNLNKMAEERAARERLQDLNEQSKTELENSLLKEALALSSENCEELLGQSNRVLAQAEESRKRDFEALKEAYNKMVTHVRKLEADNRTLQEAMGGAIAALSDDLKKNTVNEVKAALAGLVGTLEAETGRAVKKLQERTQAIEERTKTLLTASGHKEKLFWAGQVANIATLILLAWHIWG